ncbi:hypothetical protein AVEN_231433-1 [Araneus ventricosus]|uniref:Uncharacterized protein n=1 Tax=Araneus ventricosus TaxID=182803 RepID=A0A4Y2U293_ARAVE|nr:hypothetical protein AVEN_231433-1 [Araneus ventricosus]
MTLLMKLKTKGQELQKVKEEKNYQFDHLLHTEKIVDNLQKDIEILRNKLKLRDRTDYWKNLAKTAKVQMKESQRKIQNLEQSLAKEKMIIRVLQDHIARHFCRERNSARYDSENYDFFKKHTALQKLLRNKVNELNEKELQILEKDKMLETLKNSKVRTPINEHLNQSAEISKRIKEKEREIRILIAQVNMCESAIAGYENEVNSLKQILADQTLAMKQR